MIYTGNRFTMYKLVLVRGARWKGYATIRVVVRTNDLSLSLSLSLSLYQCGYTGISFAQE